MMSAQTLASWHWIGCLMVCIQLPLSTTGVPRSYASVTADQTASRLPQPYSVSGTSFAGGPRMSSMSCRMRAVMSSGTMPLTTVQPCVASSSLSMTGGIAAPPGARPVWPAVVSSLKLLPPTIYLAPVWPAAVSSLKLLLPAIYSLC